jgi:hypothetical protein
VGERAAWGSGWGRDAGQAADRRGPPDNERERDAGRGTGATGKQDPRAERGGHGRGKAVSPTRRPHCVERGRGRECMRMRAGADTWDPPIRQSGLARGWLGRAGLNGPKWSFPFL